MFSTAEEIPISLHDGFILDFATIGMMLKRDSMMLGGEFLQIPTEEKMYLYSQVYACSVLLLHLCKRGFFSLTDTWKSAASFYPVFLDFCIMLIFW